MQRKSPSITRHRRPARDDGELIGGLGGFVCRQIVGRPGEAQVVASLVAGTLPSAGLSIVVGLKNANKATGM
jgi:hypothetical protein